MKPLLTLFLTALCATGATYTNIVNPPASVRFEWTASPGTNVTGYRIYWGTATRVYTNFIDVGNSTLATVTNLARGVTYYAAATAYAPAETPGQILESTFSNEATWTTATPPAPPSSFGRTNVVVTMRIESSPSPTGPWTQYATVATGVSAPAFFRSVVNISPPAEPAALVKPLMLSPKRSAS